MFGDVVKVGNRKHDIGHLPSFLIQTVGMVFNTAHLAAVTRTLQYTFAYLLPVLGIAAFVLWLYWHKASVLLVVKVAFDDFLNIVSGEVKPVNVSVLVNIHVNVIAILSDAIGNVTLY